MHCTSHICILVHCIHVYINVYGAECNRVRSASSNKANPLSLSLSPSLSLSRSLSWCVYSVYFGASLVAQYQIPIVVVSLWSSCVKQCPGNPDIPGSPRVLETYSESLDNLPRDNTFKVTTRAYTLMKIVWIVKLRQ